ncbi:MAG: GrpB family protein [Phormidesmis sp.]
MKVVVVPHDPKWSEMFERESECIHHALGENVVTVHHIGSTAIPGIYAKPIIDLLVEVKDIARVDEQNAQMVLLGYEAMGEFGITGRRYFRKESLQKRTHHVHIFAVGSDQVERHLAFRDYLVGHPGDAQAYSELKRSLAKAYRTDIGKYMDGKDGFIKAIDEKAARSL